MLLHTLQKKYIFKIFMKKLCLWSYKLSRYTELNEATNFYNTSAEK